MRIVLKSGQSGYGEEHIRAAHICRSSGYTRERNDPIGPDIDHGPRLLRLTCWRDRYGTDHDKPPHAVYDSIPDDGRPAVEVEYA